MYSLGLILIILLIPAMVIPKNIAIRETPYKVVLEGFIATSVGILFLFVVASATGVSLGEQLASMVEQLIPGLMSNEGFVGSSIFSGMTSPEIQSQLSIIYTIMINSLPGYLLVLATLTSYFEYIFIGKLMSGKIRDLRKLPAFYTFTWPKSGAWGWLIIFGGSWILSNNFDIGSLVLTNVQILMEYYFFVQGAAVLFFFCEKKKWPKFVPPLLVLAFGITPISRGVIFILGLLDLILDLRTRMDRMGR